jgi:hypothetical protein
MRKEEMMLVEVLFAERNELTGEVENFDHVASVEAPEHYDVNRALEYAFRRCQNLDGSWSMGEIIEYNGVTSRNLDFDPNIAVMKPLRTWSDGRVMGHRSAMMYDRMIVDGDIYEVCAFGFEKVA